LISGASIILGMLVAKTPAKAILRGQHGRTARVEVTVGMRHEQHRTYPRVRRGEVASLPARRGWWLTNPTTAMSSDPQTKLSGIRHRSTKASEARTPYSQSATGHPSHSQRSSHRVLDEHSRASTHHGRLREEVLLLLPLGTQRKVEGIEPEAGRSAVVLKLKRHPQTQLRPAIRGYRSHVRRLYTHLSCLGSALSRIGAVTDMSTVLLCWDTRFLPGESG
jgi:hypothetical protein